MADAHTNLDELLQALSFNLAALKNSGVRSFDCKPETLQKLDNLGIMLGDTQKTPQAANLLYAEEKKAEPGGGDKTAITLRAVPAESLEIDSANNSETLEDIYRNLGDCTRCGLCKGRRNIVFGAGNPNAKLVFVGEGPGHDEDIQGIPFVGPAGQLLTKIIDAMKLTREEVYICNVVKCRPPDNRNPKEDEIRACIPFLERQIAAINPEFIIGLGGIAVQSLLNTTKGITKIRGQWTTYMGVKFMPTFHPSYLLRNPEKKREVWQDVQKVMAVYPYV